MTQETTFGALVARVEALEAVVLGKLSGVIVPETPVVPVVKYEFSEDGLLVKPEPEIIRKPDGEAMLRLDPVVEADCPRTVRLPVTGHVLSEPRADIGEKPIGYAMRVSKQAGGRYQTGMTFNIGVAGIPMFRMDDPGTWPEAVDRFYNQAAYRTPAEAQDAADKAAADAAEASKVYAGKWPADQIADSDAGAIYAYARTRAGTSFGNKLYFEAGLFGGTRAAISGLRSRGEAAFNAAGGAPYPILAGWSECELKTDVLAVG